MSIGFIGGGGASNQKTIDVFSGNASSRIDMSLQNVLSRYDTIKTDLDRLVDTATQKTFNVTSTEHYNMYLKESISGWAETWYAEYRAVLALRADALQKKLQAAYNRVLDKSVFAELKTDSQSVFAPYANRTFSGADVTNKMPYSEVFVRDMVPGEGPGAVPTPPPTPPPATTDPGNWTQRIHDHILAAFPYSAGGDKDGDGALLLLDNHTVGGASVRDYRDPRKVWGQYPYTNDNAARDDAFKYNNILTPPWPTYYKKTTTDPGPYIYQVFAQSGSYINNASGKIDSPQTINLGSGSYYNTVTGKYYEWTDPSGQAGNANGHFTSTNGTHTGTVAGGDLSKQTVSPGQYYNVTTGTVNATGGAGYVQNNGGSNIYLYTRQTLGANWVDVGAAGKTVRKLPSDVYSPLGSWTDVTQNTYWIPDSSKSWDINQDGTNDSLAVLLDPDNYGLFTPASMANFDTVGSHGGVGFPADASVYDLVNPYLYNGSGRSGGNAFATQQVFASALDIDGNGSLDSVTLRQFTSTPSGPAGGHPFIDSRWEAHSIAAREAQIDAAIKATDDVLRAKNITDPSVVGKMVQIALDAAISSLEQAAEGGNGHPGDADGLKPFGDHAILSPAATYHPWGAQNTNSPFYMGTDYYAVSPGTGDWQTKSSGMYKAVRQQLEISAQVLASPLPPGTQVTVYPSPFSQSYAGNTAEGYTDIDGDGGVDADDRGNYKINIPMFGMGEVDIDFNHMPADIYDTLLTSPAATAALQKAIADLQESFYTRQYDDIVQANKYDATYMHGSAAILPGWYAARSSSPTSPADPPVTLASQDLIGGALISAAMAASYGNIDDSFASIMGGTAVQVGGGLEYGHDAWLGGSTGPNLFYGHESAVTSQHEINIGGGGLPPPLSSFSPGLPQIGVFGQHSDFTIPVPIPLPTGPIDVVNIPMTIVGNASFDFATMMMNTFMQKVKEPIVEAIQVQSYAASSGTAFDSYASRGEYHFSEAGFSEALKRFGTIKVDWPSPIPGGTMFEFNFGEYFDDILFDGLDMYFSYGVDTVTFMTIPAGLGVAVNGNANNADLKERLFDYKHSVQAAESRETETGAFFATSAFLSQFQMDNLSSEYWIGTQQNEEIVNADLTRAVSTAGKEFMKLISGALFSYGTAGTGGNVITGILMEVLQLVLQPALEAQSAEIMFDLIYKDQELKSERWGFLSTVGFDIVKAEMTTEAYDYIESDHKPFEADTDFNYTPPTGPLSFLNDLYNYGTPDFILDGYAATRRFRRISTTSTGFSEVISQGDVSLINNYDPTAAQGIGPRGQAGKDAESGSQVGWWQDTDLGDINEVYTAVRKVSFNNLSIGFNEFTDGTLVDSSTPGAVLDPVTGLYFLSGNFNPSSGRSTTSEAYRYTGSDSRTYGRRYDATDPVDHEVFNVGAYSGIDTSDSVRGHYDRRNQYNLSFTPTADGRTLNLFGSQALNPTIGGFMKIAEIDKNLGDTALLEYDSGGIGNMTYRPGVDQQFGAATDGTLNELNRTLYEHLHLRADGRNLSLVSQYRDVFNMGFLDNIFISGQSYHPSGGGINSSLEIRFDKTLGNNAVQSNTREEYDLTSYDPFGTLFLNKSRGKATVYLNTYFAYKKRAANNKT